MEFSEYWLQDDFEDHVTATLVAMFEDKYKNNKGGEFLKKKDIKFYRGLTPYIPSNSREILTVEKEIGVLADYQEFDTVNDLIPESGILSFYDPFNKIGSNSNVEAEQYKGYVKFVAFRKVKQMAKGWFKVGSGSIFELAYITADNRKLVGEKSYFTIDKDGKVMACDQMLQPRTAYYGDERYFLSKTDPHKVKEIPFWGCVAAQYIADKKYSWTINAEESGKALEIGCMKEEVKSLLYARSLPLTETGRKKPILHLVESHKRRMKNGTDIDITPFLRGTQKIEMNGTLFSVKAPEVRKEDLSENSLRYYL